MRLVRTVAISCAAALATVVFAHEFWIAPSAYRAAVDAEVSIELKVGDGADITILPRNPERFEKFVVVGPDGEQQVEGKDGESPAGTVKLAKSGIYVVAYRSKHSTVDLEAEKFEAYLKEEGLDAIVKRRAEKGESKANGRERYARCAKSIVIVGDAPFSSFDRALGLRLELIPEQDPRAVGEGKKASFRLHFEGKPLANVLVRATRLTAKPSATDESMALRSNAEGRVTFPLKTGAWRINAVHMLELPKGGEQDWESEWASLTLEVGTPKPSK